MCIGVCVYACRVQKGTSDLLDLELQVVMSQSMCVLGTEFQSSEDQHVFLMSEPFLQTSAPISQNTDSSVLDSSLTCVEVLNCAHCYNICNAMWRRDHACLLWDNSFLPCHLNYF